MNPSTTGNPAHASWQQRQTPITQQQGPRHNTELHGYVNTEGQWEYMRFGIVYNTGPYALFVTIKDLEGAAIYSTFLLHPGETRSFGHPGTPLLAETLPANAEAGQKPFKDRLPTPVDPFNLT